MSQALKRLDNMVENSRILVLTSHSHEIIRRFCNKVIVMKCGEVQYIGDVDDALEFYEAQA